MPSALAEKIIAACEAAKEQGAKIRKCNQFRQLGWGVSVGSPGGVYALELFNCCPLGAALLGTKDDGSGLRAQNLVRLLSLDQATSCDWFKGFFCAEIGVVIKDANPIAYKDGWNTALEVLAWVNAQTD